MGTRKLSQVNSTSYGERALQLHCPPIQSPHSLHSPNFHTTFYSLRQRLLPRSLRIRGGRSTFFLRTCCPIPGHACRNHLGPAWSSAQRPTTLALQSGFPCTFSSSSLLRGLGGAGTPLWGNHTVSICFLRHRG